MPNAEQECDRLAEVWTARVWQAQQDEESGSPTDEEADEFGHHVAEGWRRAYAFAIDLLTQARGTPALFGVPLPTPEGIILPAGTEAFRFLHRELASRANAVEVSRSKARIDSQEFIEWYGEGEALRQLMGDVAAASARSHPPLPPAPSKEEHR